MEQLLQAVAQGELWMAAFNRQSYEQSFERFCHKYAPVYQAALAQETPVTLAEKLTEGMVAQWRKAHFWRRGAVRTNHKLMVVFYLTPMLLACDDARCEELAQELCRTWNERWPEDSYRTADYAAVADGFRNTVMGFSVDGGRGGKPKE